MRASRWLLIIGCMALLVAGFFWTKKVLHSPEIAPTQQPGPVASGTDASPTVDPNDNATSKTVDTQAAESAAAARSSADKNASQTAPNTQANSANDAAGDESNAARPPLSDEQLAELMDRHDCNNVPRTPARLTSDLQYFEFASEKWSEAMLTAYKSDLAAAPRKAANASSIQAVSALMQRCVTFDERLAAKPEGAPDIPKIDWSAYPEWASKVDVYDPKQIEKLIAAGQIKLLIQRARQNLYIFTVLPGTRGDLAYRDFRALQLLGVPLNSSDNQGLKVLQQLLRTEIITKADADAHQLANQIKAIQRQ